ncbi:MAG TPA: nickel-dependent hydrogenase large subunit [Actinomycetota bacterium]|nr:nickel-dependent hydrogenase large subunit [Actinomycetota bacterium]
MTHVVIDPVTRIEGHLRIEAEVDAGVVGDAWASGTMFRGIELILQGRDPREAWLYTQRICNVCTMVHAVASVRAVEDALGITPPPLAVITRNLIAGFQYLHDHVVTFFHLRAIADWMDVTAALTADVDKTVELAQGLSDWPGNSHAWFRTVQEKLKAFANTGLLGPLANGYWGHPAYTLAPEVDLMLAAHYLEALDWQREVVKAHAILGGKNPALQTFLVGGMALPVDPDSAVALNAEKLAYLREIADNAQHFVENVYLADHFVVSTEYRDWKGIGERTGNFLAYGDFPMSPDGDPGSFAFPGGVIVGRDLADVREVDTDLVTEEVTRAWYAGDGPAHPFQETTDPAYTGPTPPYDRLDVEGRYTWVKAPRYAGLPMEVGPLARVLVAYARGVPRIRELTDGLLADVGLAVDDLFSTLGRRMARWVETKYLAELIFLWLDQLEAAMAAGDRTIHEPQGWDPAHWPAEATGVGLHEAPRGALAHFVRIADRKIANYQCVVPTTWNASPRDAAGTRGPLEAALLGTPVVDPSRPLEILRVVHSFDPCMACAVHVLDARGATTGTLEEVL